MPREAQSTEMRIDDTALYEWFADARLRAVALTDSYRETGPDDPQRPILWERVVRQTETARLLLECWLQVAEVKQPEQVERVGMAG